MGAYQYLYDSEAVRRTSDGAIIPPEDFNVDWDEYQVWLAVPNTPDAANDEGEMPENELTELATVQTDIAAATTLAGLKTALDGLLNIMQGLPRV